jgi:hypothetical protein
MKRCRRRKVVDFWRILRDLKDLGKVKFPRSIKPPATGGEPVGDPMLLIFGGGSREASCALAYVK